MTRVATDVVVVGAGPAGCLFATRMAQLGFEVWLIERTPFPRAHLGESLTPGVLPMLTATGAHSSIAAGRYPRVSTVSTNWDGRETERHDPRAEGMLVDRGSFDAALRDHAASVGVRILQPAHVTRHAPASDGWTLHVDAPDGPRELHTAFLADASGRAGRFGGRRRTMGPRTFAIHGYWTGTRLPDHPRIEAGERAWYWGVPIPDGSYNTLVFVDGEQLRSDAGGGTLDDRLRALLARSALLQDARGATLRGRARAADATPYLDEDCVSDRHIRIGDAALAIDPLSSAGVQKAIQTALAGAVVANTLLRRPAMSGAARRYYEDSLRDAAERHRHWAAGHYATAAQHRSDAFWTTRAGAAAPAATDGDGSAPRPPAPDDVPLRLSPEAHWEERPCLGPQFVEMRAALRHPGLEGAAAFVGGYALADLLQGLPPGLTSRQLTAAWSDRMPPAAGLSMARWLSARGVLERCAKLPP